LPAILQGLIFATCVLLGVGAHAFGHFFTARRCGVDARFPYFVPQFSISGTGGAYVKLQWPIDSRSALVRIFAAGPIAGFAVSALIMFVGMALSTASPRSSAEGLELGDSLMTLAAQHIVFPGLRANQAVVAHPLFIAGIVGLNFGFWQLLPAGRFDGGRIVYALFGYKRALLVSWITIAGLIVMSAWSLVWAPFPVMAALSLIRLKRQHPVDRYSQPLDGPTIALACALVVILVLTFVPAPVRLGP
jgi:membrane-associated protease RseP (regulator of RpoE activity)